MSELNEFIENSRINESIARKLFEIETEVLACQSSHTLLKTLLESIQDKFSLSGICLLMVEPTPITYFVNRNNHSSWHQENTRAISLAALSEFHPENKPFLTNEISSISKIIPDNLISQTKSVALTPIILENQLFASLLFTDLDKNRFSQHLGTYHLEQLAVKISLCLSNVLIREQLEYMANYDRLTGVANRRLMEITLNEELIRQRRYGVPFSVIFIDCNKFKQINDTYGHDCGDKVLSYVASQIKELIRENDKCFRYAGDEFVVMLASQAYSEAILAAERLTQYFDNTTMSYQDSSLSVTISCGVAASDGEQPIDDLLKRADQQLYIHKKVVSA